MSIESFIELVRRLRTAQLDYYRDKYKVYSKLIAAKNLEKQVDAALRSGIDVKVSASVQPTVTQTSFLEAGDEAHHD